MPKMSEMLSVHVAAETREEEKSLLCASKSAEEAEEEAQSRKAMPLPRGEMGKLLDVPPSMPHAK